MKLSQLLKPVENYISEKENFQNVTISNLAIDYRKIIAGSLFFCIEDEEFTAASIPVPIQNYKKAIAKGCVVIISNLEIKLELPKNIIWIKVSNEYLTMAIVINTFYQNPFRQTKIIGISGTNGKTTTNQYIYKILKNFKKEIAVSGTLGIHYKQKIIQTGLSTPLAIELFEKLAQPKIKSKIEYLTMEITSHSNYYNRVANLDFKLAIFTNLTQDHLDFHTTWENYKKSKIQFFANLAKKKTIALLNSDDRNTNDFIKAIDSNNVKIYTYGINNQNATFLAKILSSSDKGSVFEIIEKKKYLGTIDLKVPGIFNVYNALAAFCCCYLLKFKPHEIIKNLVKDVNVVGRFEKIPNKLGITIVIDYAHTPDSLENVLRTIKNNQKNTKKKLITVFGCGGERDSSKRALMGKSASKLSDLVILTNDNPRNESQAIILRDIQIGIPNQLFKKVIIIKNRKAAIIKSLTMAKPKDTVLIAGKGHENYQIIGKKKLPFSDRKVVLEFLNNNGK